MINIIWQVTAPTGLHSVKAQIHWLDKPQNTVEWFSQNKDGIIFGGLNAVETTTSTHEDLTYLQVPESMHVLY